MKFKTKIYPYSLLVLGVQNVSCAQWLYDNLPEDGGVNSSGDAGQTQSDVDTGMPTGNGVTSGLDEGYSTGKTSWMTLDTTKDDASVSGFTDITMSDFSTTVVSGGEMTDDGTSTRGPDDPLMDHPKAPCPNDNDVPILSDANGVIFCRERSFVRFVFVTKERFLGNSFLDIPAEADAKCEQEAAVLHSEKTFKAWQSFSGITSFWHVPSNAIYFSQEEDVLYVTGTVDDAFLLSNGWQDFTDGELVWPINRHVDGVMVKEGDYVWTGTGVDGSVGANCESWINVSNVPDEECGVIGDYGRIGNPWANDETWTRMKPDECEDDDDLCCLNDEFDKKGLASYECYNSYPIYCIEQKGF